MPSVRNVFVHLCSFGVQVKLFIIQLLEIFAGYYTKYCRKQARQISAAEEFENFQVVSQQSLLGSTTSPETMGFTHFSIGILEY